MAKISQLIPITTVAGVQPVTETTSASTSHYVASDKIRTFNGRMQKIGGWLSLTFDYSQTIAGTARSLYTNFINGKYYSLIGTNTNLYSLINSRLENITPLSTSTVAIANSLATNYTTLANNPITTQNGSMTVTIADTSASRYKAGLDTVYLSGAVGFAGLTGGDLTGGFLVRSIGTNSYTITLAASANANTSGGGAAVVRSSGLVQVTKAAHGLLDGARVKLSGAVLFGGITALQVNVETTIRNIATNTFDIMTTGQSTSSVTADGGASTVYQQEIATGALDEGSSAGYGAGLYGVGLYGTALTSSTARAYPRIWYSDRYANTLITTAGNQTGLYQWAGDTATAPVLITNAPTAINYQFVSNNIIVTFGAGGTENRIYASDNTDITVWTSSSTNQVYDDDIEGAGRFISHCPVENYDLIFTEYKTYKFRYIGLPLIWEITPIDESIGLIAPEACVSAKGMAFWMGQQNFYLYRGGTVEIIPSNSQDQTTLLNYVFQNLNFGQKSKCFGWYNKSFNEIWFHYPSASSNECDRVARVNLLDYTWTPDTMARTCAEYPNITQVNPRLLNVGTLYKHEFGYDADGVAMPWSLQTNLRLYGKDTANQVRIVPDSIQNGDIIATVNTYLFPQSTLTMSTKAYTVTPTTEVIEAQKNGRFYDITFSGNTLGQDWKMGAWYEEAQAGAPE